MKKIAIPIAGLLLLLVGVCAFGATSVSPTAITTGLRWDNVSSGLHSYVGTTITVSGSSCTSGSPCVWTIVDQNGTTITTLTASGGKTLGWPSAANTPPDHTAVFGQIDCTGSAANTACVYNAPAEWPSGETATITVNGGANGNATVALTFNFAYNLQEYFKHRARILGFQTKPYSVLLSGNTYQPELTIFESDGDVTATEQQFIEFDNGDNGTNFPVTAGSSINRPAWTYDGKWFNWHSHRCIPSLECAPGSDTKWFIAQSNGSNLQRFTPASGGPNQGFNYTFFADKPNWVLTSDAANIYVIDLANSMAETSVATYPAGSGACTSSSNVRCLFSYPSGRYAQYKTPNAVSCSPISPSCSFNTYIYDLLPCESSLVSGCAVLAGNWNSYLQLTGFDGTGAAHCNIDGGGHNCEYHAHDIFMQRGGRQNSMWLYGPFSTTGEAIFWQTANGTGTTQFAPSTANNAPYFSHPGNNWSGDLMEYGGARTCTPSGNACTDTSAGEGIWDFRQNKAVIFDSGASVGHTAYDGFDNNVYGYDGRCSNNAAHWCFNVTRADWKNGVTNRFFLFDYGQRDVNAAGDQAYSLILGPTQSADATKFAENMHLSFANANRGEGFVFVTSSPQSPVRLRLTTSSAATLGWFAHPLNHETQSYYVYKQPSCSGNWSRLAGVNAIYGQAAEYTYTDSSLASSQNACYGVSSSEWGGVEADRLSNIVQITNTAGTFSSANQAGAGTVRFDTTAPTSITALAAAKTAINTPGVGQSVTATTGGSLSSGTYWVTFVYGNYADFPANTAANVKLTTKAPASSVVVNSPNNAFVYQTNVSAGGQGQAALQVYACGPSSTECAETLQMCSGQPSSTITMVSPPPSLYLGYISCTINSIVAGSALPASNQTTLGYKLTWTKSSDDGGGANDVRFYAVYSRDDAAPVLSQGAYAAQQWLLATPPAGTASFLDYTPNWTPIYNAKGGPYYAIVAVDRLGNRSTPVCLRADTNTSVGCN